MDFLIEILDYNENVLSTKTLTKTTKEEAIDYAVRLCQTTPYSYCFNLEKTQEYVNNA